MSALGTFLLVKAALGKSLLVTAALESISP
jgi:hypothetical protein